jgi:CRP-like cAMP-binding protein
VLRTLRPHERLSAAHESDSFFFAVRKGLLKAVRTDLLGRRRVSHVYVPGDLISADLLKDGSSAIDIVAVTDSMVCDLDSRTVANLCDAVPTTEEAVRWLLARGHAPPGTADYRCAGRLDLFLKRVSNRLRARGLDDIDLLAHLTQQDVADILQVDRGSVRRAAKALSGSRRA